MNLKEIAEAVTKAIGETTNAYVDAAKYAEMGNQKISIDPGSLVFDSRTLQARQMTAMQQMEANKYLQITGANLPQAPSYEDRLIRLEVLLEMIIEHHPELKMEADILAEERIRDARRLKKEADRAMFLKAKEEMLKQEQEKREHWKRLEELGTEKQKLRLLGSAGKFP